MNNPWTCERNARNVHTIRIPYQASEGWEQYVLLQGDHHFDNPDCDRKKLKKHLERAVELNAPIIGLGDFFDMMQGRQDPRQKKRNLLPRYTGGNYYDLVIEDAVRFFSPYAHNLAVMAYGNHETGVIKRQEFDPLLRFLYELNTKTGACAYTGGYTGWIRFLFSRKTGARKSFKMKYYHDMGSSAKGSKGVLAIDRRLSALSDVDIIVGAHIHRQWFVPVVQEYVNAAGKVKRREVIALATPTYKDEFQDGAEGFHIEQCREPRPVGAWWLRFFWEDQMLKFDPTRAM